MGNKILVLNTGLGLKEEAPVLQPKAFLALPYTFACYKSLEFVCPPYDCP